MLIVLGFGLLFVGTVGHAIISTWFRRMYLDNFTLLMISISAGLIAVLSASGWVGWRIFTSSHHQGPENLTMVAALNFGTVIVSLVLGRSKTPQALPPE